MDKKYIQDNEIDIKYLRGQLADDELELFEIYLMENPEALEQLEVDSLLLTTKVKGHKEATSLFSKFKKSLTPILAIAFSIVATAILVVIPSNNKNNLTAVYTLELENLRSTSPVESPNQLFLERLEQSKEIDLTFFLAAEVPEVDVRLFKVDKNSAKACDGDGDLVFTSNVAVAESKYSFLVPPSKFNSGEYVVCAFTAESLIIQYRVSVVKEK